MDLKKIHPLFLSLTPPVRLLSPSLWLCLPALLPRVRAAWHALPREGRRGSQVWVGSSC